MNTGWTVHLSSRSITFALLAGMLMVTLFVTLAVRDLRAQGDDEVIHACVSNNSVRLVNGSSDCRNNEQYRFWNVNGPQGPQGMQGPQGPAGSSQVSLHLAENPPSSSTRKAFIKVDGIEGGAQEIGFEGWSSLISLDQQIDVAGGGVGAGRAAGKAVFGDIVVVKEVDKSSPKLAEATAKGQHFPLVEIHLTHNTGDAGLQSYFVYELRVVMISSYQFGGSGQSDVLPTEQLSLKFGEIKAIHTEMADDGSAKSTVEYQWKVEEGTS